MSEYGPFPSRSRLCLTEPRSFGSVVQPLKYVKRHDRGGHFAAWETSVTLYLITSTFPLMLMLFSESAPPGSPELLLGDVREFTKIVVAEDPSLFNSITARVF